MKNKIQLYKDMQAMKDMSERGETFSIAFRKYNRQLAQYRRPDF